jgi:hypothetical protein
MNAGPPSRGTSRLDLFHPPTRNAMAFSIQTSLGELLDNEQTKAILEKHMPGIAEHPQIAMGRGFPLAVVANFSGGLITPEILTAVDAELAALG